MVSLNSLIGFAIVLLCLTNRIQASTRQIPPLLRSDSVTVFDDQAEDGVNYRLPNNTEPVHYNVELTTNVHTGDTAFLGVVTISLNVLEDTRTIVLHARQLFITSFMLTNGAQTHALNVSYEEDREFLTFVLVDETSVLPQNSQWNLIINYNGTLRNDNGGFYLSSYTATDNTTRYLATTQFESTNARHGFPCYDEPAKRATFKITINHNAAYNAISNLPVNETASSAGKTVFETSSSMSTYLVAFIVSDFEWSEGKLNDLTQRVYSRPGTKNTQEWSLVSGMLVIQRLAEYYGIPFAFPKLDQVAVPDFAAGAMENWGLVTYREEYLLYNPGISTVNTETNIVNIIAHEYAHQWFGNYVCLQWWTYLWLKESFATLFSYQAADDAYPEWGIYQMFHAGEYQSALVSDAGAYSRPMTHYVQKPSEISSIYDVISYSKGGSVLHMWQNALTDTVFRQGLHNYLERKNFSYANEFDLFIGLQTAAKDLNYVIPDTIENMLISWTRQSGYPLLTVKRNYNDGTFTVTQEQFYNNQSLSSNKTWYVPINFAVQSDPDFRDTEATHYLLNETQILVNNTKVDNKDWLILNKQSTGYYRINYDEDNWNLIIAGLQEKSYKIHPRNRAQFMHDAYRFAVSNRLKHSILMNLLTYLPNEDQYAPWATANAVLTTFNRYLSGDSEYGQFKYFVSEIVGPAYDKLGVNDIPGEQHFQKYTRTITINLACLAGIQSCLIETNNKLLALINYGTPIEPNLQLQTYCNGLRQSGDNEFNFVYNKLMNSNDQAERRLLISALGCSQQEAQINKFISSSIDTNNTLRTQERTTLLSPAYSRGEVGLLACISFLNENWQAYANLTAGFGGTNPLDIDIRGMSQYVVNKDQEAKLLELVAKVKTSNQVSSTLESGVQANIDANFKWLDDNRTPLMSWIKTWSVRSGSTTISASFISIILSIVLLASKIF